MLYVFLISLNLVFLSYELIIFNEEFFIAFTFFSFFFAASSVVGSLVVSFYAEDRSRIFHYAFEDNIHLNYSFFYNYLIYLIFYEYNKEFLYQYINLLGDSFLSKISYFYDNILLNDSIFLNERIPEIFFNFSDKLLNFIFLKIQSNFLIYFNSKWEIFISSDIIDNLDVVLALESINDE